jgi:hypothetical protein
VKIITPRNDMPHGRILLGVRTYSGDVLETSLY